MIEMDALQLSDKRPQDVSDTSAPLFSAKRHRTQFTREEAASTDVETMTAQLGRQTNKAFEAQQDLEDVADDGLRSFQDHFVLYFY